MHYLYIIYSKITDSYYVGETYDIDVRMIKHNTGFYKKSYSRKAKDWQVVLTYTCENKKDAVYLERFIKRMKSRKFVEKIISNQKILKALLDKK